MEPSQFDPPSITSYMQHHLYVLAEGSRRTRGGDAQTANVAAGRAVATAVRTTLGPPGTDKMLVDSSGDVVVTNDGATILGEMDIEHPAAQMLVEVAESQEAEVGDGTTTAAGRSRTPPGAACSTLRRSSARRSGPPPRRRR